MAATGFGLSRPGFPFHPRSGPGIRPQGLRSGRLQRNERPASTEMGGRHGPSPAPYYARFDVVEDRGGEPESFYLSRTATGADTTGVGGAQILSWDTDMARAYRSPSQRRVEAQEFRGQALLRRQFTILSGDELTDFQDTLNLYEGAVEIAPGADPYLARLLRTSGTRARAIVTTLAEEQDKVVFANPTPLMVLQGAPGSGKTQVGQLRIAALVSGRCA